MTIMYKARLDTIQNNKPVIYSGAVDANNIFINNGTFIQFLVGEKFSTLIILPQSAVVELQVFSDEPISEEDLV